MRTAVSLLPARRSHLCSVRTTSASIGTAVALVAAMQLTTSRPAAAQTRNLDVIGLARCKR